MKLVVQVSGDPYQSQGSNTAYHFILTALKKKHSILRVFFYQGGVYNAFRYAMPPDDECQVSARWSKLAEEYGVDLVVCISAAQRRGLLCEEEASLQGKQDRDLADGFRIAGLGQLAEAMIEADRVLMFR